MTDDLPAALRGSVGATVGALDVDPLRLLRGVEQARARQARTGRRRALVAVATSAAAVVALVLVPSFLADRDPALLPSLPADPVPAGSQAVSWHGVQVLVPAAWELGARQCSSASADTVLIGGSSLACDGPYVPGLTVVEFDELPPDGRRTLGGDLAAVATTPGDLDGTAVLTGSAPLTQETGVRRVLVVPSEGVVLSVRSPDAAKAEQILATARVVAVDDNGCHSRLDASRPSGPADRADAAASLLPGVPAEISACEYAGLRLVASRRLLASQLGRVQRLLDALPTGVSGRIPEREISPQLCREIDDDVITLDARYPRQAAPLRVFFRGQSCTDRSVTNGSTTRRTDGALLGHVRALVAGRPLELPTDRTPASPQPAPELGFAEVQGQPQRRADLLARTDDRDQVQLVGVLRDGGIRCISWRTPVPQQEGSVSCASGPGGSPDWVTATGTTAAAVPSYDVVVGATSPSARSVRVLVGGRPVATVATWGGGAAYAQRRFFLVSVPPGAATVELVAFDSLGDEVDRTAVAQG